MPTIDPTLLEPMPAPFWFVLLFKVVGFLLHIIPMGLWFGGTLVTLILYLRSQGPGRRFAVRFLKQLPVIMAIGINFGIVPLLFTQVAYFKAFYTSTIVMAWYWLSIIGLVTVAYYILYFCAFNSHDPDCEVDRGKCMTPFKQKCQRIVPWVLGFGFVSFVIVAFLFSNAMVRMSHPDLIPQAVAATDVDGAVNGLALLNPGNGWHARVLMVFGLGLMNVAAWILVDATWFFPRNDEMAVEYRDWAKRCSLIVLRVGVAIVTLAGLLFLMATWNDPIHEVLFGFPVGILTLLVALGPTALLTWAFATRGRELTRSLAAIAAGSQVVVLLLFAILRQIIQSIQVNQWFDVFQIPVNTQWSPIVAFLVTFVLGVVCIIWMIVQVCKHLQPVPDDPE